MKITLLRKILFICLLALPTAFAGMPEATPIAVSISDWTGFYIGFNTGGAWAQSNIKATLSVPPSINVKILEDAESPHLRLSGFTGGAEAGYNLQFNLLVLGLETDFDYFRLNKSLTTIPHFIGEVTGIVNNSVKTEWLFTARPRLGLAYNNWLIYGTAGVGITNLQFHSNFSSSARETGVANANVTRTALIGGGGIEVKLSRQCSVKVEYLNADFPSSTVTGQGAVHGIPSGESTTQKISLRINAVRAGLNYQIGIL